jgi:hypothetical protein
MPVLSGLIIFQNDKKQYKATDDYLAIFTILAPKCVSVFQK